MTLEAWYRINAPERHDGLNIPEAVKHRFPMGMRPWMGMIEERDGTTLAEFIRHGEKPLVRQVLPSPLTVGRWNLIREMVLREGGETITIPRNTLGASGLMIGSIEVVDTTKRSRFRAHEQLIRGTVPVRRRTDDKHWGPSWRHAEPRVAYFLSGYDTQEKGWSYFFCELPTVAIPPTTVAEAYALLEPESVKRARKLHRKVLRQGDMFFIRMPRSFTVMHDEKLALWTQRRRSKDRPKITTTGKPMLHNSNHAGERVLRREGLTYASGVVRHVPQWRPADHAPLNLGSRWWLCVRNTVPVVGRG